MIGILIASSSIRIYIGARNVASWQASGLRRPPARFARPAVQGKWRAIVARWPSLSTAAPPAENHSNDAPLDLRTGSSKEIILLA